MSEDEPIEALEYMSRYVVLRPEEVEASRAASRLAQEVLESDTADTEAQRTAFTVLRSQVETGDPEVRRTFIDAASPWGVRGATDIAKMVLRQVEALIEGGHADEELYAIQVQMLQTLRDNNAMEKAAREAIGLPSGTDEFTEEDATAPHKPIVYAILAKYLRQERDEEEVANRIIEKMVERNPESAEAHVLAYNSKIEISTTEEYLAKQREKQAVLAGMTEDEAAESVADQLAEAATLREEALESLARAYELDPEDAEVLGAKGGQLLSDYSRALRDGASEEEAAEYLNEAAEYLKRGADLYPDNIMFIRYAAQVEKSREDYDKALEILQRGLKTFKLPSRGGIVLTNQLIEIYLLQNDIDAVQEAVEAMRDFDDGSVKALAEYHAARIELSRQNWTKAAKMLRIAKIRLLGFPAEQALASFFQGVAHEQLGQLDLAAEAYEWAVAKNPGLEPAHRALAGVRLRLAPGGAPEGPAGNLDVQIARELDKPRDEQDWDAIDRAIEEFGQSAGLGEAGIVALRAQTALRRAEAESDADLKEELFVQARNLVKEAFNLDKSNIRVRLLAIRLLQMEPGNGPKKALALLEQMLADPKIQEQIKYSADFRITKAQLLAAIGDDDLVDQLLAVGTGIEDWPVLARAEVYAALGQYLMQAGALTEARQMLERALEATPNNLITARLLFNAALRQRDPQAIDEAQKRILDIVGSDTAPDYVLAVVRRRLIEFESGEADKEDLKQVSTLLADALKARPNWSELWVAKAQLELSLNEDVDAALRAFDRALEVGRPDPAALRLQIVLLAQRGNMVGALKKMELLSARGRISLLGRLAAQIYAANGRMEDAYEAARATAEANPEDAATQLWFADFAALAEETKVAETALRKAAAINPYEPQVWSKLIGLYLQTQEFDQLESVLREAHLALDAEFLPLLNGRYYELRGQWHQAEDIYLSAYRDQLDTPDVARRMAEFYTNWPVERGGDPLRAAKYINLLLREANEGRLEQTDSRVAWARRKASKILASRGDYASAVKAEEMLAPLVNVPSPAVEDLRQLAQILSVRQDPAARLRAIELWRKIKDAGELTTTEALLLGQLMSQTGQRSDAQLMLEDLIARNPDDVDLIRGYALLLIEQRDSARARRQIASLERKGVNPGVIAELELRLAARSGDMDKVRELLQRMTPDMTAMNREDLDRVRAVAELANEAGDLEFALRLYTEYARRDPTGQLPLARLAGLHGDPEAAVNLLKKLFADDIDAALVVALEILRARRPEVGDQLDADIDRLVRRALADDPESARRLVMQAEVLEIQEKFDESMAAYEDVLRRGDLPPLVRATALNNLAYLIALRGDTSRIDESLDYANEAMQIIGPISDLLDTRAVVQIARGEYEAAAEDMRKAVQVNPTASKFYHLAQAELGAGNEDAALEAWRQGIAEGLSADAVSRLERETFEKFADRIADLGGARPDA